MNHRNRHGQPRDISAEVEVCGVRSVTKRPVSAATEPIGKSRKMRRDRQASHVAVWVVLVLAFMASSPPAVGAQLRLHPDAVASAPPELLARLRADPFMYFRLINRAWTQRVCQIFA